MEPTYHLEGIIQAKEDMEDFEGPLNLILMLLSKNKIEIRNIQISLILDQYMAYLEEMESMDLEIASEFIQMASYLVYIKTKMLLTSQEPVSELELLMTSLEQLRAKDVYTGIKSLTELFSEQSEKGYRLHTKAPEPLKTLQDYRYKHEPHELLKAVFDVFTRMKSAGEEDAASRQNRLFAVPQPIKFSVKDKSREILERLSGGKTSLRELYAKAQSRSEIVATLLSILELCSRGNILISGNDDEIYLTFVSGDREEILESISE